MFKRFKSAKKIVNAGRSAARIASFVAPCVMMATEDEGGLNFKLKSDEFVLGYIYGVIAACMEAFQVNDLEEQGYTIQQVFDRLFPNEGRALTELCNQRALQKQPEFMRSGSLGYAEMTDVFNSEGHRILNGLMAHICNVRDEEGDEQRQGPGGATS